MKMRSDTIAAISTPHGKGGIGVIRVSGPDALGIVDRITLGKRSLAEYLTPTQRKLVRSSLINYAKEKLDDILIAIMPPNRSFTGETLIELHCHGSELILRLAMKRLIEQGARLAEPGEFTRRAMENDRLDLIQAEAINEVVNAQNNVRLRSAIKNMDGDLSKKIRSIRDKIYEAYMICQYCIDFDEDLSKQNHSKITESISQALHHLNDIIEKSSMLVRYTSGYRVSIHGSANSGKSTLFNALLQQERSIVDETPGTTRDYISEMIEMEGEQIILIDTAGTHDTNDPLTKKAISKSKQQLKHADLPLLIIDQSAELKRSNIENIKNTQKRNGIVVFNKSDKVASKSSLKYLKSRKNDIVVISAKKGINLNGLITKIIECYRRDTKIASNENAYLLSERQKNEFKKISKELLEIFDIIKTEKNLDIIADIEQRVLVRIDDILGKKTRNDTLENIFKRFCVGK